MYTHNAHFNNFITLLKTEKIHLNPALNLDIVADKLNISANYLSQIINKNTGKTFCEIIGKLRVDEIKQMLDNNQYEKYTLLSIGLEAGFNSKSVFYRTFKKFTRMTPSEYKEKLVYSM
ncbi:helix-turn-helix domain-containing protein [Aquimarina sp. 2304DJ70-9]|uniref:helix-turn-helix domain-containing protein n=1 Tax=Aquimarina penaris TaxID=3231044 RepID=UPI0034621EC1